jgi:hypothetical protein
MMVRKEMLCPGSTLVEHSTHNPKIKRKFKNARGRGKTSSKAIGGSTMVKHSINQGILKGEVSLYR